MQLIEVVVGGQYGSEAKGHITAQLVKQALIQGQDQRTVINIRVAGPNAGHSVIDENGELFKLRTVPVGAAISDDVVCYIAPGSELDMTVLASELDDLRARGHNPTLLVSSEVTLLDDKHIRREGELKMHEELGSTGKGIGAARADRIMRTAQRLVDNVSARAELELLGVGVIEPEDLYARDDIAAMVDQHLIIEGTQGYGLGLHAGSYPYVTSSDCRAIDFMAMAGVNPWNGAVRALIIWVVARAYPIRVAGNSGPLENETSWEALGLPEERTTVTNKVRRVGLWDAGLVKRAVQANGGAAHVRVALTMADQIIPGIRGFKGTDEHLGEYPQQAIDQLVGWTNRMGEEVGARIGAVTTSPDTIVWVQ